MLYKYLSDERLSVLENLKIRFTQPLALNDPFEALPIIDTDVEKTRLIDEVESDARELWEKSDDSDRTIENQQLLNNSLESLRSDIRQRLCPYVIGKDLMSDLNEVLGVLSLTKSSDNLLMWSHYASEHRGYVLGFDDSHEFFYGTTYSGGKSHPKNVIYTSQRSRVDRKAHNYYEKLLCEKPINWSYEEEARLFYLFTDKTETSGRPDSNGYPVFLFDIPKDAIKSIYIGANASNDTRKNIASFVEKHDLDVELYEARISKFKYELEFNRIE